MRDIVAISDRFDALWYADHYGDVAASGFAPDDHFALVGARLGRGISARVPQLLAGDPLALALARRRAALLARFGETAGGQVALSGSGIAISYCIPTMDRLCDLELTLATSLAQNRVFADRIEFIVLAFEDGTRTRDWLKAHFRAELATGYLRFVQQPRLPVWHFGIAKNRFRGVMAGQLYSSLDADNCVTAEETALLLQCLAERGANFIFHHFSGVWGDGSSGRLTLPWRIYESCGYDAGLFPRQFDEVDAILTALCSDPELVLVHYQVDTHVLETDNIRAFLRATDLTPQSEALPLPHRIAPANPKPDSYVSDDPVLRLTQSLNEAMSFVKNLANSTAQAPWLRRIEADIAEMATLMPPLDLLALIYGPQAHTTLQTAPPHGRVAPDGQNNLIPQIGQGIIAPTLWHPVLTAAARAIGRSDLDFTP